MKTKLLKKIRKKYQIIYNPDKECYLVRNNKCHIQKYEATGDNTRWYYSSWDRSDMYVGRKKWHFYWMLMELGYGDIVNEHVRKMYLEEKKRQERKKQKELTAEFAKYYKNEL